jgi:hypothetical protein
MATTVSDHAQTAQEQTLKTVREGQQAIIEASAPGRAPSKAIETPSIPTTDSHPQEIVRNGFEFAGSS